MSLLLNSLEQAIDALERSIKTAKRMEVWDDDVQDTVRAGVIQNFEVAYEQSWKMMKRWLEENIGSTYVDGVSRRKLFRLAAESHLITDVERWMDYHNRRNQTSHTYDEDTAQSVFEDATEFVNEAKQFFSTLEAHND
jgi:nucleotidyltransferase substrate binding protein (TIGR01987 family)